MTDINERVAWMIGYRLMVDDYGNPINWARPGRELEEMEPLPDFEHSRDACVEILDWITQKSLIVEFSTCLLHDINSHFIRRGLQVGHEAHVWSGVVATAEQLCLAALAVGENKT